MKRKSAVLVVLAILLSAVTPMLAPQKSSAAADVCTWTGNGLGPQWTDSGNWTGCDNGNVPENGDELIFPAGASNLTTTNNIVGLTVYRITFQDNYVVNGNAFSVSAGIASSAGSTAINVGVTLAGSLTFLTSGTGNLAFTNSSSVNLNGFNLLLQTSGGGLNLYCVISGAGNIIKVANGGQVQLTQNNTFSGTFTVSGGNIAIYHNNALGTTAGSTIVNAGATVNIATGGLTIPENFTIAGTGNVGAGALRNFTGNNTLTGTISLSGSATIQSDTGNTLTINGVISGGISPDLTLVGTVILNGDNTYGGNTIMDGAAGADLTINGNQAVGSDVIVNQGGTLRGNGTVTHIYLVNAGSTSAILSPGAAGAVGTLTTTGNLTFDAPGMDMDIDISGATADQVVVAGDTILDDANLNLTLLSQPSSGTVFTILKNDGANAVAGTFHGLAEGTTLTVGGIDFRISYVGGDGNDITLTVLSTPTNGGGSSGNSGVNSSGNSELIKTGQDAGLYGIALGLLILTTLGIISKRRVVS